MKLIETLPDLGRVTAADSVSIPTNLLKIKEEDDVPPVGGLPRSIATPMNELLRLASQRFVYFDIDMIFAIPDAALLYRAIQNDDDLGANEILASKHFGLPVIKALMHFSALSDEGRIAHLQDAALQLAEIQRKGRERTKKAIAAKRLTSKKPAINAWLARQEAAGQSIMERSIAGKIAIQFNVEAAYARKIRSDYLGEKTATTVR
ncbi:hypothetical protein AAKU55_000536 [Oxalobacteraceae bacterium GrIS 1.11]